MNSILLPFFTFLIHKEIPVWRGKHHVITEVTILRQLSKWDKNPQSTPGILHWSTRQQHAHSFFPHRQSEQVYVATKGKMSIYINSWPCLALSQCPRCSKINLLKGQPKRWTPCISSYSVTKRESPLPFPLPNFASTGHQKQITVNNRCHNDLFLSGGTRHRQIMRQESLRTGENKSWKYTEKG